MSIFGFHFGQNADIDIVLDDSDHRRSAEFKDENGRKHKMFLFYDGEPVSGKVNITLHRKTNRLEHNGIRLELIGQIEFQYDRGSHQSFPFLSLVKLLEPGGPGHELTQSTSYDFDFEQVEKPYESYAGANVKLRYFLRVTICRRLTDMVKEMDILVHTLSTYPEAGNAPIQMEVGIDECLHIEFQYNKSRYHLKDVIVGKIYFLLVRIKIKHMEVAILKRETAGSGPNVFHENETIAKYEIMDGAPVKGESIPIRVFLAGYDLSPTMREVHKRFSVRYFINLVLVDEEERRYFKQQEITLWRKWEDRARPCKDDQPTLMQTDESGLSRQPPTDDGSQLDGEKLATSATENGGEQVHQTNGDSGPERDAPPPANRTLPQAMMRHEPVVSVNQGQPNGGSHYEAMQSASPELIPVSDDDGDDDNNNDKADRSSELNDVSSIQSVGQTVAEKLKIDSDGVPGASLDETPNAAADPDDSDGFEPLKLPDGEPSDNFDDVEGPPPMDASPGGQSTDNRESQLNVSSNTFDDD